MPKVYVVKLLPYSKEGKEKFICNFMSKDARRRDFTTKKFIEEYELEVIDNNPVFITSEFYNEAYVAYFEDYEEAWETGKKFIDTSEKMSRLYAPKNYPPAFGGINVIEMETKLTNSELLIRGILI